MGPTWPVLEANLALETDLQEEKTFCWPQTLPNIAPLGAQTKSPWPKKDKLPWDISRMSFFLRRVVVVALGPDLAAGA